MSLDEEAPLKTTGFDTVIDGRDVNLYWIENDSMKVAFTNYEGRIVGLWIPDKKGELKDVEGTPFYFDQFHTIGED